MSHVTTYMEYPKIKHENGFWHVEASNGQLKTRDPVGLETVLEFRCIPQINGLHEWELVLVDQKNPTRLRLEDLDDKTIEAMRGLKATPQ